MKILITGKNSYIGNSFNNWVLEHEPSYEVDHVSLRNINLSDLSFKGYDVVFHVAGIAHISSNKKLIPEYFRINRDLAIQVAKKAKEEGVKQFIFTSSMAIYGDDLPIGVIKSIDVDKPKPTNAYGQSKLEADLEIQKLSDNSFKTVILRIPMIYGKNAKGNLPKLEKVSNKVLIFPKIFNQRSVLNIKNLNMFVFQSIKNASSGIFYPQDNKYFITLDFIKAFRKSKNKNTILIPFTSGLVFLFALVFKFVNKIFGNKFYSQAISIYPHYDYQKNDIYTYLNED
jgi:UDP-glucose 4-epimerase